MTSIYLEKIEYLLNQILSMNPESEKEELNQLGYENYNNDQLDSHYNAKLRAFFDKIQRYSKRKYSRGKHFIL
jgi:hypothetical protein